MAIRLPTALVLIALLMGVLVHAKPMPQGADSIECGPKFLVCNENNQCCSGRSEAFVEAYPELQFCRGTTDVEGLPEPQPKAVPDTKPQDAVFRSLAEGAGTTPKAVPEAKPQDVVFLPLAEGAGTTPEDNVGTAQCDPGYELCEDVCILAKKVSCSDLIKRFGDGI